MTHLLIGLAVGAIAALLLVIMWRMVGNIRKQVESQDDLWLDREHEPTPAEHSVKSDHL